MITNELKEMKRLVDEIHGLGVLFAEREKERQRQLKEIDNAIMCSKNTLNDVKEANMLHIDKL